MNREDLLRAIGGIDDDLIVRAHEKRKKKPTIWISVGSVAACLAIAVAAMPYLQTKKDAAMTETTTATGSSTAAAEWFDADTDAADSVDEPKDAGGYDNLSDSVTGEEEAGNAAPTAPELKAALEDIASFAANGSNYRLIDKEEQKVLGLTEEPSEALAGEFLGSATDFVDRYGNKSYRYTADETDTLVALYRSATDSGVYLLNFGDDWYYAVEEMP